MTEMLTFWKGKPFEDLSRDELLEVIDFLGEHYRKTTTPEAIHARAVGEARVFVEQNGRPPGSHLGWLERMFSI